MTDASVLVIGAGSAGARHARNLAAAGARVTITDPDAARADATGFATIPFDLDRLGDHDGIVVASPTTFHAEQATAALATGARVLVEKPLAMTSAEAAPIVAAADGRVMVGYNLRLHAPLEQLAALLRDGRAGTVTSVRLWFGSWLPDWRPTVDYRQTYSARRDLGGGVLLDAIHELDLLVWLGGAGDFRVVGAVVDRVGPLEIDVEDTVRALLRRDDGVVAEVALDYLSRRYRRGVEVIGDAATLRLDWARGVLEVETAAGVDASPASADVTESYVRQAERFVAFVRGDAAPPVDATEGARSVALADAIRAAG
ncbi:MAG TPA: Gfo/Idh/MocA family oxidoreductase [Acidimicrobiales bacterium]|nr:Gfo/Idh/MocA family oxidoreductase [Acidimicrobiales bacterium]